MRARSTQPVRVAGPSGDASVPRGRRLRRIAGGAVAIMSVAAPIALGGTAQAATSVTPGTVTLSQQMAGSTSNYTVPFTVSGSGALAPGATITLTAPDGTALPGAGGSYAVGVNNSHSATVQSVTTSDVTGPGSTTTSATPNQVVITLATSTIANGDTVTVTITGASNPTTSSTSYVIDESSSADTAPAASRSYTVLPGAPAGIVATGGDNQSSSGAFAVDLSATPVDVYGNPVDTNGLLVTFAAPASGASGTFAGGCHANPAANQCQAATSGATATASTYTANGTAGGPYAVTATLNDAAAGNPVATFYLTNLPVPPGGTSVTPGTVSPNNDTEGATSVTYVITITATSGSGALANGSTITLLAPNGTAFSGTATNYTVTNSTLMTPQVVSTVSVSKATGPGANSVSATNNEVQITLGVASSVPAGDGVSISAAGTTNPTLASGSYVVDESTSADTVPAATSTYSIVAGPVASIAITSGDNQSAEVGTSFAQGLGATAFDAQNNPVPGTDITFTIGTTGGASAKFPNNSTIQIEPTGANGEAITLPPKANSTAGSYTATATDGAVSAPSPFTLTNTTAPGTPGQVTVTPNTEGSTTATYTVPFTTTVAIPPSGSCGTCTITLVAPNGTAFPSHAGNYAVGVDNGHAATVASSGVSVSNVTGPGANSPSATPNQVIISLSASTIAAGDTFTVTITGVTNPTVASSTYVMDEATSSDQTLAASPTYAIVPGPAAMLVVTAGNNQSAGVNEPFATQMSVATEDAAGNAVADVGVAVTFTAQSSGASGSFPAAGCASQVHSYDCTVDTDANGNATAPVFTANDIAGGPYTVTAAAAGLTSAIFSLTNLPVLTPGAITVNPSSAGSTATYTIPFTTDAGPSGGLPANPVAGPGCPGACTITLVAPNNTTLPSTLGDYGVIADNNHAATVSNVALSKVAGPGSGGASATDNQAVITLSASSIAPGDVVTVTISGVTSPTVAGNYTMDESTASDTVPQASPPYAITAGIANKVLATNGTPQAAEVGTAYATALQATVEDSNNNPEPAGVAVTFTAPSSGASGSFDPAGCPGNTGATPAYECITSTNANGVATASTFTAGATPGQFTVVASSPGASSADFMLTNETAVSPGAVTLTPSTAGASGVSYVVPFTTSSAGALGAGGTITIVAPNDTTWSSTAGDYAVAVNNSHSATVGSVAVSKVDGPGSNSTSPTNNKVVISLSASTIAAGDTVTVALGNATNPTAASNSYTLSESTSADPIAASSPAYAVTGLPYTAVTPTRICDTRAESAIVSANQCNGNGTTTGTLSPGGTLTVTVPGLPAGATAVVLNVTVTNTTASSFLTVWPTGSTLPNASNLNWVAGDTVPNLVEVTLGPSNQVNLYNAFGTTDVVVDLEGYVAPIATAGTGLFNPLSPARICDTRAQSDIVAANPCNGNGTTTGTLGQGGQRNVQVTGEGGVPASGVAAVVLNVTVTNTTASSFLTVWPTGHTEPNASNVNWVAGQTVPNRVIVPVGTGGQVTIANEFGSTDVVVDVGGWFTDASNASATGARYVALAPTRICDTRAESDLVSANQCNGNGTTTGTLGQGGTAIVQVTGLAGVPAYAVAVVANTTVTNTTAPSFLTVYPDGTTLPNASDLNWVGGETVPNLVVVELGSGGAVDATNAFGGTDVIMDVEGFYE
jgi:hypothetical protein